MRASEPEGEILSEVKDPANTDKLKKSWRRGWESNPRIKVLQTSPLPLGYRASILLSYRELRSKSSAPRSFGGLPGVEPAASGYREILIWRASAKKHRSQVVSGSLRTVSATTFNQISPSRHVQSLELSAGRWIDGRRQAKRDSMNILEFSGLIAMGSLLAGFLGALTGLGGGVVVVPMLALLFHIDIRYAIGASLVSVIATSSGAAAAYVREGFSNIRIGMFLETATTIGAIVGAAIALHVSGSAIAIVFGLVLLYSAFLSSRHREEHDPQMQSSKLAEKLRLPSTYPTPEGKQPYSVTGVPAGYTLMFGAGVLSGLLGIGSGAVKVLAMDQAMKIPFKVSTTTSNFMIGVTAAASAGLYLSRGYIAPGIAMPVMLGVLAGSMIGARVLVRAKVKALRYLFAAVIVVLGVEMIFNGVTGRL
jgi:uncharacterized protein